MAGRPPKEKSFANMLNIAISQDGKKPGTTKLRDIAEKLVEAALDGESWAIQMVADRTDGKVPQAVVGDNDGDPINLVAKVIREIVRPKPNDPDR